MFDPTKYRNEVNGPPRFIKTPKDHYEVVVNFDTKNMNEPFIAELPEIIDPEGDKIDCKVEGIDGRMIKVERQKNKNNIKLTLSVDRKMVEEKDYKIHVVKVLTKDQYMASSYSETKIELHILKISSEHGSKVGLFLGDEKQRKSKQ